MALITLGTVRDRRWTAAWDASQAPTAKSQKRGLFSTPILSFSTTIRPASLSHLLAPACQL
jgi:hypothetical protein